MDNPTAACGVKRKPVAKKSAANAKPNVAYKLDAAHKFVKA